MKRRTTRRNRLSALHGFLLCPLRYDSQRYVYTPKASWMHAVFKNISNSLAHACTIALLVCQGGVHALAQENTTKILENERVAIWKIGADARQSSPAQRLQVPGVLISLV